MLLILCRCLLLLLLLLDGGGVVLKRGLQLRWRLVMGQRDLYGRCPSPRRRIGSRPGLVLQLLKHLLHRLLGRTSRL